MYICKCPLSLSQHLFPFFAITVKFAEPNNASSFTPRKHLRLLESYLAIYVSLRITENCLFYKDQPIALWVSRSF